MFSSAMFHWEYHAATRKRRPFVARTIIAVVLVSVALAAGFSAAATPWASSPGARDLLIGRTVFIATVSTELLVLMFLVPAVVAGAIAEERERDTLPWL